MNYDCNDSLGNTNKGLFVPFGPPISAITDFVLSQINLNLGKFICPQINGMNRILVRNAPKGTICVICHTCKTYNRYIKN